MSKVDEKLKELPDTSRRDFLRGLFGATAVAAVASAGPVAKVATGQSPAPPASIPLQVAVDDALSTDVLERMRAELTRTLQKAPADRRWVMVIDLRKCVGCHACTIACVAENKLPPGSVGAVCAIAGIVGIVGPIFFASMTNVSLYQCQ